MIRFVKAIIWLFVFIVPWEDVIIIPEIGTFARIVGLFAAGLGLFTVLLKGKMYYHPFLLTGLFFVSWSWASLSWSIDQGITLQRVFTYAQLWLMAWLIYQFSDRLFLESLFKAYIFGSWIAALLTFYAYLQGFQVVSQRYAAAGFDPNDLSFYLYIAIPLAVYLAVKESSNLNKVFYLCYIPIAIIAVLLTSSRMGAIGVAITLFLVLYMYHPINWRWRLIVVILIGVGVLFAITQLPPDNIARIATLSTEIREGTLNERTTIWAAGFEVFSNHTILGIGAGAFRYAVEPLLGVAAAPHNVFLSVAVECGIVGFLMWLLMMVLSFGRTLRMESQDRQFWLILLVCLLIACMAINIEWRKTTWLIMALAAKWN